ncbi:staygreen family protein [Clostridium paraputrificum]|uniref:staygreen family protein n=1 Tax=Clostridium paraputrificum TaxID=29363 RepID=UPI003D334700
MSDYLKEKLFIDFEEGMETSTEIMPRKYTLTHSDETGDLFLYIGENYACNRLEEVRDEVLATWEKVAETYILKVDLHLDSELSNKNLEERDVIFRKELPLALKTIIYGDRKLYMNRKELINSPVIVYFNSNDENYNKVERWGAVKDYIIGEARSNEDERIVPPLTRDKVIITLLTPHIDRELKKLYGNKFVFCATFAEIMSIRPLNPPFACKGSYIVVVGVRTGLNIPGPNKNNVILEFLIKPDQVRLESVKNPR